MATKAEQRKAVKQLAFDLFKQAAAFQIGKFSDEYADAKSETYFDGLDALLNSTSTTAEACMAVAKEYYKEDEGEEDDE